MHSISVRATRASTSILNCFKRSSTRLFLRRHTTIALRASPRPLSSSTRSRFRVVQQYRAMSDTIEPCEACKTQPAVVNSGYEEKGKYPTIADHKTYVFHTTPMPKMGVLIVYDIFGYRAQTLQGADQIALTVPAVVVMPDYFHDKPMKPEDYPPKTEEDKQKLGDFFSGPAQPQKTVEATKKIMAELKQKYPSVEKWGVIGFCWGGKIATLVSQSGDFTASAQAHPAMLDTKDAEKLDIPHLILASEGEDPKVVKECSQILVSKNNGSKTRTYPNIHGWMGARGNLENAEEAKAFEEGYGEVIEFFKATL